MWCVERAISDGLRTFNRAAWTATQTIPIIFIMGDDPVRARSCYDTQPAHNPRHGRYCRFDAQAARRELVFRRIGRNEQGAIQACLPYVKAQREYAIRFAHRAPLWRDRARPCPLAQARAHDGRRRDRGERAGQRFGVHGALAGGSKHALTETNTATANTLSNPEATPAGHCAARCDSSGKPARWRDPAFSSQSASIARIAPVGDLAPASRRNMLRKDSSRLPPPPQPVQLRENGGTPWCVRS